MIDGLRDKLAPERRFAEAALAGQNHQMAVPETACQPVEAVDTTVQLLSRFVVFWPYIAHCDRPFADDRHGIVHGFSDGIRSVFLQDLVGVLTALVIFGPYVHESAVVEPSLHLFQQRDLFVLIVAEDNQCAILP